MSSQEGLEVLGYRAGTRSQDYCTLHTVMYVRSKRGQKTTLSEEDIVRVEKLAVKHLNNKGTITNRELRAISAISYDQAIYFFGKMLRRRILWRRGTKAGTYYVLK